jgi:hypothetical protein
MWYTIYHIPYTILQHTSVIRHAKEIMEIMMSTFRSAIPPRALFSEPNSDPLFRRLLTAAQAYWSAVADGLAAARTYEETMRHGATHAQAVEHIFDRHLRAR